ncbi:hypothetical protein DB346_17505 [Verrucomicrobia bacterium LW23]|nr:hypothetical protein DB346_17505 [Verrucomicrobia bacterium LW23]
MKQHARVGVRKLLSDAMWAEFEKALAVSKHSRAGAPPAMSDRDFIEAILYLYRAGCPWRDLPQELGYWHAVYMRYRRWLPPRLRFYRGQGIRERYLTLEL